MKISRVGIDLAKNIFQLHGVDRQGNMIWKRRLSREKWLQVLFEAVEPGTIIGMEACTGAHHWARLLNAKGYTVKIIPPQFVKPFVKSNKNDANDAQAICEAMMRPNMHPVSVKTVGQQDLQAIHRIRSALRSHRNAIANQIRGLVSEYGLVAPKQLSSLRKAIPVWLDDESNGLTALFKELLRGIWEDYLSHEERLAQLTKQLADMARNDPITKRLQQIRGVGPLVATALVATVGDATQYRKGRDMAAAIGLTPRQHSSGGKERLLGITKRGDSYLRSMLVNGAQAVIWNVKGKTDRLSRWVISLLERKHPNVVAIALANKIARIAWAIMTKGENYNPDFKLV